MPWRWMRSVRSRNPWSSMPRRRILQKMRPKRAWHCSTRKEGMGAVHSLSHSLGALGHHHGTLNAIMLPHVVAYNAGWLAAKMPVMRDAMGLPAGADLPAVFAALNQRLGLPPGLYALGIEESVFPAIAEASLLDNAHKSNPRALTGEDYMALLNAAR